MKVDKIYNSYISHDICKYKIAKKIKAIINPFRFYKYVNNPIKDIVNCGAPRSGSTLLNIILKEIVTLKVKALDNFCSEEPDYINKLKNTPTLNITKTHNYSWLIAKRIEKTKSIGFFTHRDIRDVIVSQMQKGWIKDVDEFLKNKSKFYIYNSILYAQTKNMIIISYEKLMNDKKTVIKKVGIALNVELTNEEIDEIDIKTSLNNIKKKIDNMEFIKGAANEVNSSTGLHKNHINDPTLRKWRNNLTPNEINLINKQAAEYIRFFNYSK